jgi:NADH:ubiquinone oxidoreductase subunit C
VPSAAEILATAGIDATPIESALGAVLRLDAARVADAGAALRDAGYDFLVDLFGTDTGEAIEVTYHVRRLAALDDAYLKCLVPYEGEAPSIWRTYPAALYPERECAELLGMRFPGHPNPKHLLTTEAVGPLLRRTELIRGPEEVQAPYE